MNFEQAKELSFLVKWKVAECFSGPQCWCRRIVPVDPILYNDEYENFGKTLVSTETEEYEIIPDAAIDQKTAEYIVELHNERHEKHFDRVIQNCRDAMKETMDSLISLEEMTEQFEKLWENKQSKIGKIVRKEID
jgi:flagellar motility protein MotE (MotC chaperone)